MSKPVKVYNKGKRPIVYKRNRTGVDAIHPGKFLVFAPSIAKTIIEKYENACTAEDYKKHIEIKTEKKPKAKK